MRKIKILHISPDSIIYGTEKHILSILKYSNKNEFEHSVAMPTEGAFNYELKKIGVRSYIAGRKPGYRNKFEKLIDKDSLRLYKLIKKEKFDIVHTHLNTFGGFVGKLAGAPIIIHTRHGLFWSEDELEKISFFEKYFQKMKSNFFDITIAIGEYEKTTMVEKFNYNLKKIRTTINGVNVREINYKVNKELTKKDLFGTDDFIIGTVGRLEKQKGFSYLIDTVYPIKNKLNGMKFVLIGNGSCKEELIKKRDIMGLQDKIIFIDYKKNILDYVYNFDIMVLTSLWEGLSYAVQEAMALQKPVIALTSKNVSGIKEIIVHGVSGYLIEDDYIQNLGKYIIVLSKDLNKRLQIGRAAAEREKNTFPEWQTAKDMDNVYKEIFNEKISFKKK